MLDDESRELAIADKDEFIYNKIDMVNTLFIFKCNLKEYLNYLNGLSGAQYNRISLVMSQDEEVKIQELQDEMIELIDDIIELLM